MPFYAASGTGIVTLRVGDTWASSGGEAHAGSSGDWGFCIYAKAPPAVADFSKSGGVWTRYLASCSAVVHLMAPRNHGGGYTHGVLWHVNCSSYDDSCMPDAAIKEVRKKFGVDVEVRDVVVGFTGPYDTNRSTIDSLVRSFRQRVSAYGVTDQHLWYYVSRSHGDDGFGVSAEGYVGAPTRMVTDKAMDAVKTRDGKRYRRLDDGNNQGGGGIFSRCKCYITTATCLSLGLGDDCAPLTAMRAFRDDVLLRDPVGRVDVARYYETAPAIVAAIDARPDARRIYGDIHREWLVPALDALGRGEHATAWRIYRTMVGELEARHAPRPAALHPTGAHPTV